MKLWRVIRHRCFDESDARRTLGADALQRLQQLVTRSETHHSGEIRICVEAGLPLSYLWRDLTPRDRAVTLFGKLRVWDTEHNNGVLIYLLLAERAIEVVADRGLGAHVSTAQWRQLLDTVAEAFRGGRFEDGLAQTIGAVDTALVQHFPLTAGQANPNELPDAPLLR